MILASWRWNNTRKQNVASLNRQRYNFTVAQLDVAAQHAKVPAASQDGTHTAVQELLISMAH